MTVVSLTVALTRMGLLFLPFVAANFTTGSEVNVDQLISDGGDVADALAVMVLWIPFAFCGFGGDVISHEFGLEAAVYFLAIVVIKTAPFIDITWNSVYWWAPVVLLYTFYFFIVHTRYRIYYEDAQYTREEQLDVYGKAKLKNASDSTRKDLEAAEFQHISLRNLLLLVGLVVGFNAGRTILFWWHTQSTFEVVYNDQDTLLLYSMGAETLVSGVLMLRIRSMYSRFNRDFWQGAGGVIMLYLYLQVATVWILSTWEEIALTAAMVVFTMGMAIVIERQVTQSHVDKDQFVGLVLIQWASELVNIALSSQMGMITYILLSAVVFNMSQSVWYETRTNFPDIVQTVACPLRDIIDNEIQVFFDITLGQKYRKLFTLVRIPLSRLYNIVEGAIFLSYPYLQDGCEGADVQFTPLYTYWVTPFLALPWMISCFLVLYVFLEGRRVINTPGFWSFAFLISVLSCVVVQLTGDVQVSLWYLLLPDTEMNRVYTWEGVMGTLAQIGQMAICISMYRNKHVEKETRKRLHREPGAGAVSVKNAIVAEAQSVTNAVTKPRYLVLGASIVLLVFSLLDNGPVDDMNIMFGEDYGPPTWLATLKSQPEQMFEDDFNWVLVWEEQVLHAQAAVDLVDYIKDNYDWCFGPAPGICPFDLVSGLFHEVVDLLKEGAVVVAGAAIDLVKVAVDNDNVKEIADAMLKIPSILEYPGYTLFEVPSLDLPSLRIPQWLIYSGAVVGAMFLITSVAVLALQSRQALLNEVYVIKQFFMGLLVSGVTSIVLYAILLYLYLTGLGFELTITWNSSIWRYAASLVLFVLSFFFEIGEDLEPELERRELEESAREMNAEVGSKYWEDPWDGGETTQEDQRKLRRPQQQKELQQEEEEEEEQTTLRRPVRALERRKMVL